MNTIEKLPNMLPLGYIYLVIMGVVKEGIFYYQLDINILKHTTIMDVLLSPIADIISEPIFLVAIIPIYLYVHFMRKSFLDVNSKRWVKNIFGFKKNREQLTQEESINYINNFTIQFIAAFVFSIFIGFGLAGGYATSNKIDNNNLEYNYKINLASGITEEIYLIEANSLNYIYVTKGSRNIKFSSLSMVNSLEQINNTTQKKSSSLTK